MKKSHYQPLKSKAEDKKKRRPKGVAFSFLRKQREITLREV